MELWIVGQINPSNFLEWEFQGVFDSEEKAVSVCEDENWFIGPAKLNECRPSESEDWPEAYYPKRKWEDIWGQAI